MDQKQEPNGPNADIDGLIRVLSHQLKSPVNAIESLLNVVLDGFAGDVDARTAQYLKKAVAKAQDARTLIADLLRYEQFAESNKQEMARVDLTALLSALAGSCSVAAAEKSIALSADIRAKKNIIVMGSRSGLESAFRNLIDNAIKYTPEQGTVTISIAINEERKQCAVSVRDTGCGIAKEDRERLFTPFFRSAASKGGVAGSGLGLAIVKRVAERHGGTVAAQSGENKGTVFTVTLPYAELEERDAAASRRKHVVIVGGVTAGPKAAARLRRLDENADITIIEKSEFLSYTGCGIPSYVRGSVQSPKALMSTADNTLRDVHFFEAIKNIRIINKTEAIRINRGARELRIHDRASGAEWDLPYDVLVLATGAASVVPPIKGIDSPGIYSLYRMEDAEAIRGRLAEKPASDVCILGGGLVGIETAESLLLAGGRVMVLEKDAHILKLFDPDISDKISHALGQKGIKVVTGVDIKEIRQANGQHIISTSRGDYMADIIILSAGVRPNAALAEGAGLAVGQSGGIKVNEFLQTSDPAIYAIGDCAESRQLQTGNYSYLPLGSISTKMGRIAADNICGRKEKFEGSIGTTMFKIFDIQVARTGLSTPQARECGYDPVTVVVSGLDRAHYEAGARHIVLKALADRTTMKLLGAQGYGKGDVASRIEVLAVAIARGCTLEEVFALDLGYYPAFNNPIDIAQTACLVLKNKIEGLCDSIDLEEFERVKETVRLVDVSPLQDHSFSAIPGSVNVPLENLRQEGIPFGKDERVVVYSKTSSRAYEACCYLRSVGYGKVAFLEGGYIFWKK